MRFNYLPVFDECAPDMTTMEACLDWLVQAIGKGHKILMHCNHGIGPQRHLFDGLPAAAGHGPESR